LPIHLHRHELGVHHSCHLLVGEGLVGHHMAPVAGGVAHGQQDRHVPAARLGEGVGPPFVPIHRVVGVLAQVRGGGVGKCVGHPSTVGRRSSACLRVRGLRAGSSPPNNRERPDEHPRATRRTSKNGG